jgi:hypothetical protein
MFSVCNGKEKSANWIVSNAYLVFVSALIVRPISLIGVNVIAPAFCLKFGQVCNCCVTAKNSSNHHHKKNTSDNDTDTVNVNVNANNVNSNAAGKGKKGYKNVRGTQMGMHGRGIFHAASFGGDVNEEEGIEEMVLFHEQDIVDGLEVGTLAGKRTPPSTPVHLRKRDEQKIAVALSPKKIENNKLSVAVQDIELTEMNK